MHLSNTVQGLNYRAELPSPQDYKRLRDSAGWGDVSLPAAQAALSASLCGARADLDGRTVAMARCIGDGVLNIYIQDVVVAERLRDNGIGKGLISALITQLKAQYPADCTIGLMAAQGQEPFYTQFGFITRPGNVYGAGMNAPLGKICL